MTTYNYLSEMQELCFKAAMALSVTDGIGMKDFYLAANEGFCNRLEKITKEEAEKTISQSQLEQYLRTQDFVALKEKEAADKINASGKCIQYTEEEEKAYDEYGFEVYGEKAEKAEPCQDQDNSKSDKPTRYDEDGLGLLDFD